MKFLSGILYLLRKLIDSESFEFPYSKEINGWKIINSTYDKNEINEN
jgi:hypothetical protein